MCLRKHVLCFCDGREEGIMENREKLISNRRLKRFLEKKLNGKFGSETANEVNDFVEKIINCLCEDVNAAFEEDNQTRKFYGLRERKVISQTLFKYLCIPHLYPHKDMVLLASKQTSELTCQRQQIEVA